MTAAQSTMKPKMKSCLKTFAVALVAWAALSAAAPRAKRLGSPRYIPLAMRNIISERMEHHGEAAMRLSLSVVLLDYGDTWEVAQALVDEPGIARTGGDASLNASLPPLFFDLQDQLRSRVKELRAAAAKKNGAEMSAAYGRVTETCVACHSVYLNGPGSDEAKKATVKAME